MQDFPNITSAYQMMEWLANKNIPFEIVGETKMGLPILMIHKEGKGRPVVITAGAHASEPSGVSAAMAIIENWNYSFPLYMFPLRDPLGCQPYAKCLSHALYREVDFSSYEQLNELLLKYADKVYIERNGFLLVSINGIFFTNIRYRPEDAGPRQNERYVNEYLKENPDMLAEFARRRIVCPANMPDKSDTVHCYERAFTAEISDIGVFSDMNRQFGVESAPPEVKILTEFVDKIQPGLVLDLHEGFEDTYYFFTPDYIEREETRMYVDLMSAACAPKFPKGPWRLSRLLEFMPELKSEYLEPAPGVLQTVSKPELGIEAKTRGTNFSSYCSRYCPATTIESGIENTLRDRVEVHLLCAKAALDRYEELNGEKSE